MHIVTIEEMRELEAQADRQYGLTSPILMENAGKSAADVFIAHLLPYQPISDLKLLFLIEFVVTGCIGLVISNVAIHQRGAARCNESHVS